MSQRIPVIYVLSSGRSGSTLLDLLLGAHPEIWTLGEAQHLKLWRDDSLACGCGEPLPDCPFWRDILPTLTLDGFDHFRDNDHQGRVLRPEHLLDVATGRCLLPSHRAAAEAYGALNAPMFEAARSAAAELTGTEPRWLVDASKDPYRLLWLEASGRFDVRVVHLVKDPRAFVWSMTRKPGAGTAQRRARFAARWAIENALMRRLTATFGERGRTLRYETLASDPDRTMGDLGAWLGCGYPADGVATFRKAVNHAVSGNKMRFEERPVSLDESWRRGLRPTDAWGIWAATLPTQQLIRAAC